MSADKIFIKGAREHNLKNIDISIPRDKLVVVTGLSGSGKSSLAFDTLYAEGQRRYVESLSAYARQFLGLMEKPDVDYIEGLSPAISIDQKTTSKNPRSTVGTVTEIYDYLRLLYARVGIPHCPNCGREIQQQTVDQMVDTIMKLPNRTKIQLLAPIVKGRKGQHKKLLDKIRRSGYVRIRIDGNIYDLSEEIDLEKNKKHSIEVVVDRIVVKEDIESRLTDSLETVLRLGEGTALVNVLDGQDMFFSQNYACPYCNISISELSPRMFSFNSPFGACDRCHGLGTLMEIDPDLLITNRSLSLIEGGINSFGWNLQKEDGVARMYINALSSHYGFAIDVPIEQLDEIIVQKILYGTGDEKIKVKYNRENGSGTFYTVFEGIVPMLQRRYKETSSQYSRQQIESLMSNSVCPECNGARLRKEVLAVTVGELNIRQVCDMPIRKAFDFFNDLTLSDTQMIIADQVLKEIRARLKFLTDVGLEYLTLSRAAGTLSGGEAQRIRLATQIGSGLVGVLYILDEPSIGLHQRDNRRLINTLQRLKNLGNTLIVVEHDEDTIRSADHVIDIGPGAGVHGGQIISQGTIDEILDDEKSITGKYLSGKKKIEIPKDRLKPNGKYIEIKGASENNLKGIDVKLPLGVMTCITGVSGSGKSTLINEILYKTLARSLHNSKSKPGAHKTIKGLKHLDKVININQSPIGRTPRSNPATYTGVFDYIRDVFAKTPEARVRGYNKGRFSFNVKGGRCEACSGDGIIKIEMHFLPDVYIPCEVCNGKRYNRETLEVRYKGCSISDVLDMTVEQAMDFFDNIPRIKRKLKTLNDVGLGYIRLGQPSTTLSGGEAQRIKLATELSKRSTGKTLYILDEPTTGLHMADVERLISILRRLTNGGNSVVVIEHNLDVIKTSDYIIDLGPEGGDLGGQIVGQGTPEELSQNKLSYTGQFLSDILKRGY